VLLFMAAFLQPADGPLAAGPFCSWPASSPAPGHERLQGLALLHMSSCSECSHTPSDQTFCVKEADWPESSRLSQPLTCDELPGSEGRQNIPPIQVFWAGWDGWNHGTDSVR